MRQTERTTQRMLEGRKPKHLDELETDPNVKAAIQELERVLGTKVRIVEKAKQKGRIEIEYYMKFSWDFKIQPSFWGSSTRRRNYISISKWRASTRAMGRRGDTVPGLLIL